MYHTIVAYKNGWAIIIVDEYRTDSQSFAKIVYSNGLVIDYNFSNESYGEKTMELSELKETIKSCQRPEQLQKKDLPTK